MSWAAVAGAGITVGGGLLSGALSGDDESPQRRAQRLYSQMLYQDGGIMQAMARDRSNTRNTYGDIVSLYQQNLQGAKKMGKAGRKDIHRWRQNEDARGDQSLINRGLYNTTVTDSQHRQTGAEAQRMKGELRENVSRYAAGQRIGLAGALGSRDSALQNLRNQSYDVQLQYPLIGLGGAPGYQLAQQQQSGAAAGNYSQLLAQLMGSFGNSSGGGALGGPGSAGQGMYANHYRMG